MVLPGLLPWTGPAAGAASGGPSALGSLGLVLAVGALVLFLGLVLAVAVLLRRARREQRGRSGPARDPERPGTRDQPGTTPGTPDRPGTGDRPGTPRDARPPRDT